MSTPKIIFFIQSVHRAERRAVPGSGPVDEQLFGLAHRVLTGAQFRRGAGDTTGGNQQESPGVPRCQPAAVPRSRTIVPDPDVFQFRSRCPDGIITRTNLRVSPDPHVLHPDVPIIPNISR